MAGQERREMLSTGQDVAALMSSGAALLTCAWRVVNVPLWEEKLTRPHPPRELMVVQNGEGQGGAARFFFNGKLFSLQ